jgi:tetratricopeptide (TPR) repeat protein
MFRGVGPKTMNDLANDAGARASRSKLAKWLALAGLGIVVLLGVGYWVAASSASRRAAESAGVRALEAGRLEEAATIARSLERSNTDSAFAQFLLARVALAQHRPQDAIDSLRKAEKLGYPQSEVVRQRALMLVAVGRIGEAAPVLRTIQAQSNGPDPEVDQALARIYLETFDFGRAAKAIDRWIHDAPADARPYLWRTEIWRHSDPNSANLLRDYTEALRRNPNLDEARLGVANALYKLQRYPEAADAFDAYLAHKPNDPAAHLGAGRTALIQGDFNTAIRHLDRAVELAPLDLEILLERAAVDLRRGNARGALTLLDRARRADPYDSEACYRRALALGQLGRTTEAKAEQARAQELKSDNERMDQIRKGLLAVPNDRSLQSQAARWLAEHGHFEEAVAWAKRVLGAEPDHPAMNRLMADYYERQGNPGLANFYRAAGRSK